MPDIDESMVIGLVLVVLGAWMVSGKDPIPDRADPDGTTPSRGQKAWRQNNAMAGRILIAFGVAAIVVPLFG